ncbi:MAG: DUF2182 domain-containing protein [Burkholderiaceae bacterium]
MALERLLRRDRRITLAALVTLCALAWLYTVMGPGLDMNVWQMTAFVLFPHQHAGTLAPEMTATDMGTMAMAPAPAAWGFGSWTLIIAMWWIMMIAMMAPSAIPAILLYALVHRQALSQGPVQGKLAPTGVFTAGYLLVWLAFSVVAAALHWVLERYEIVSPIIMGSQNRWFSAGILIAAGLYQLSPLKNVCLSHCRAPASFLSRHWRPRALGALHLGALHGAYCVGCCWLLMLLLFVGGVMNLIWIAALALLVLIEKAWPAGQWLGRAAGAALIGWGIATLWV